MLELEGDGVIFRAQDKVFSCPSQRLCLLQKSCRAGRDERVGGLPSTGRAAPEDWGASHAGSVCGLRCFFFFFLVVSVWFVVFGLKLFGLEFGLVYGLEFGLCCSGPLISVVGFQPTR